MKGFTMKTIICLFAAALLSACGTTGTSNAIIDPSLTAAPICQPNYGLPGCYSGGGGE